MVLSLNQKKNFTENIDRGKLSLESSTYQAVKIFSMMVFPEKKIRKIYELLHSLPLFLLSTFFYNLIIRLHNDELQNNE